MAIGVDVSTWQRNINWPTMRASGVSFAYVKASEGVGYVDPMVDSHLSGARGAGMYSGLYHFCRPDTNAPEADAAHFAAQLHTRSAAVPGSLPPCLDMEKDAAVNMVAWTQRCIAKLRELTDHGPVMIYANTSWWNNQLGGGSWMDDQTYGWVAHYGRTAGNPGFRNSRTVMHQYSDSGDLPGYGGRLDVNECWVDLSVLTQGGTPLPIEVDPRPDGWWTVASGQSLSTIADEVGVSWQTLAAWNSLADPDLIYPGQRLRLTAPESGDAGGGSSGGVASTYTVQSGDTLSAIASRLGTTWQTLFELNRGLISDPDHIQVGWVLATPGGIAPAPQTRWYTVQPGDSLSSIAASQGVSGGWNALYQANRDVVTNPDHIQVGWRLRLP